MDERTWFSELGEEFAHDPEYITHGLLLEITGEICRAMEEERITRSALAERVGVARQRVTNFLNTPSNTTLLTIVRFAEALGLSVHVDVQKLDGEDNRRDTGVYFLDDLQVSRLASAEEGTIEDDSAIAA